MNLSLTIDTIYVMPIIKVCTCNSDVLHTTDPIVCEIFTAGGTDFHAINNQQLGPLSQTQRMQCIEVTIIQNDRCDSNPNKMFLLVLSQSGTQLRDTTLITIDDTSEPECCKYY